jgi:hypothetical protein
MASETAGGKEREVANYLANTAEWIFKPTRRARRVIELATPPSSSGSRSADADLSWLSRHSSRPLHGTRKPHEPYVDLSPLDLSKRH